MIIDVGFGGLRTAKWVIQSLSNLGFDHAKIRYVGIDINSDLEADASTLIRSLPQFRGVQGPDGASPSLHCMSIEEWFEKGRGDPLRENVDIVLASYSLHHTSSRDNLRKSLMDGSFPRFFVHGLGDLSGMAVPDDETLVYRAVSNGWMLGAIAGSERENAAKLMCSLIREFVESNPIEGQPFEPSSSYAILAESIISLLPDARGDLFTNLVSLLRPEGLFLLADPNGFSRTFNRQHVLHDWPIIASNFEEWRRVVNRLYRLGMRGSKVWRQLRRVDLSVVSVPIDRDTVLSAAKNESLSDDDLDGMFETFPAFDDLSGEDVSPLEIEDFHLGYIVRAIKPKRSRS